MRKIVVIAISVAVAIVVATACGLGGYFLGQHLNATPEMKNTAATQSTQ